MTLPQIIVDLMRLLLDLAVPSAICTMVLAGIALRREGGLDFQAGGHFQKWVLWSVIFLTLPQLLSWLAAQGITLPAQGDSIGSPWVMSLETTFNSFVSRVVVTRLVPVLAAFFVVEGGAGCGTGTEPAAIGRDGDLFVRCIEHGPVDAVVEQRFACRKRQESRLWGQS
ncbi:MAG: hypothetical protein WCD47_17535 [Candidatus Sulfotelmatobacter sp.]